MQPFTISPEATKLKLGFLKPADFESATSFTEDSEFTGLIRQWIIDGTPFAFAEMPMLYEVVRAWLSSRLEVHPLQIRLVGSGRTGFSMAPPPDFGRQFSKESDLDIAVASSVLFKKCKVAFEQWSLDYKDGTVNPRNDYEKQLWDANIAVVPKTLERGFLDANKIPTFNRYLISQTIHDSMWRLVKKLELSSSAPTVAKASVRVYNDWHSFQKQVRLNLEYAIRQVANHV
jgi:hypothetical protein